MRFTGANLTSQLNNTLMMDQELARAIEKKEKQVKKVTKRKKIKKQEQVAVSQNTTNNEQVKNGKEVYEAENYKARQDRKMQFERIEKEHNQEVLLSNQNAVGIQEALILAEIVGKPRCRTRQRSRMGRG